MEAHVNCSVVCLYLSVSCRAVSALPCLALHFLILPCLASHKLLQVHVLLFCFILYIALLLHLVDFASHYLALHSSNCKSELGSYSVLQLAASHCTVQLSSHSCC